MAKSESEVGMSRFLTCVYRVGNRDGLAYRIGDGLSVSDVTKHAARMCWSDAMSERDGKNAEIERLHGTIEEWNRCGGSIMASIGKTGPLSDSDVIGEIDQLRADADDLHALIQLQADLLSRTAIAIRGPEPPLTQYSHADAPERIAKLRIELEVCRKLLREACEPGPAINWVDWIRRAKAMGGEKGTNDATPHMS